MTGEYAAACAQVSATVWGLSPWTARVLFVLLLLVLPGSQILVYPILWL